MIKWLNTSNNMPPNEVCLKYLLLMIKFRNSFHAVLLYRDLLVFIYEINYLF